MVVVIIAVIGGMTVLSLEGRAGSSRLRGTAQQLLRFAEYARDHAVARGATCRLVIDEAGGRFYLERETREDSAAGEVTGEFETITTDGMRPVTLGRGVKFGMVYVEEKQAVAGATSSITFDPLGEADASVVEVTDGTQSYTLRIAPATGRAEVVTGQVTELLSDRMDLDE